MSAAGVSTWERVQSRSSDRYYWRRGKQSQWRRPDAHELIRKEDVVPVFLSLPVAVIRTILSTHCEAIAAARFCASSRGSFLLGSADEVWQSRISTSSTMKNTLLQRFGQEPKNRIGALNIRVDAIGREVYKQIIDNEIRSILALSDSKGGSPALDRVLTDPFLANCAREALVTVHDLKEAATGFTTTNILIKPSGVFRALRTENPKCLPTLPAKLFNMLTTIDALGPNASPTLILHADQAALNFCVRHSADIIRCFDVHRGINMRHPAEKTSSSSAGDALELALSLSPQLRAAVDKSTSISLYQLLRMTTQSRLQFERQLSARRFTSRMQAAISSRFRSTPSVQLDGNPFNSDWF